MEEQFELKLYNSTKTALGVLVAIPGVLAIAAIVVNHVPQGSWQLWLFLIIVCIGGYIAYITLKWWATYAAVVAVGPSQISMRRLDSNKVTTIPFADVVWYRHREVNDIHDIDFKLINNTKVKIGSNGIFGKAGNFAGLVQAVEQTAAQYQSSHPTGMVRKKSFFEKKISTILLILAGATIVGSICAAILEGKHIQGNAITGCGSLLIYFAAWYAARDKRK